MYRIILTLSACAAMLMVGLLAQAGHKLHGGCNVTCPKCSNSCCVLKAECGEEEKSCFNVECEEICIPRVVFPWQKWMAKHRGASSCDSCGGKGCSTCSTVNNGAWVKTVRRLKKDSYTCPKCKYEWSLSEGDCCGSGSGCCDAASGCDADLHVPALEPDQQQLPTEAETQAEVFRIPPPSIDTANTPAPIRSDQPVRYRARG